MGVAATAVSVAGATSANAAPLTVTLQTIGLPQGDVAATEAATPATVPLRGGEHFSARATASDPTRYHRVLLNVSGESVCVEVGGDLAQQAGPGLIGLDPGPSVAPGAIDVVEKSYTAPLGSSCGTGWRLSRALQILGATGLAENPRAQANASIRLEYKPWHPIGHANDVVAMTGTESVLMAVTGDRRVWVRPPTAADVPWTPMMTSPVPVRAVTSLGGLPIVATTTNRLLWLQPALARGLIDLGHANGITGLARIGSRFFATTADNRLWTRDVVGIDIPWQPIGHANDVRSLTASGDELVAITGDGKLWERPPTLSNVNWRHTGWADGVRALADFKGQLWAATTDNRLLIRTR